MSKMCYANHRRYERNCKGPSENAKGERSMQRKRIKREANKKRNQRNKENDKGYIVNKKLFKFGFVITLLMIATLIYTDGFSVLGRTYEIKCEPYNNLPCNMHYKNGTPLILQAGETLIINGHDNTLIPIINYTSLAGLIIMLLINHLIYNRKYELTFEKFGKLIKREFSFWFAPLIWIMKKAESSEKESGDEDDD